jgi:hypothetical protein
MSNGNDMLMSGGTPWAKWPTVGSVVVGVVQDAPIARQSRDFDTGEPAFWNKSQDPKMEVVITVQTAERDPEIEGDTGLRQIVLGKGTERFQAVQAAVRAAKATGIEAGGTLAVKYVGDEPHEKKGFNAKKKYAAEYKKPEGGGNSLLGATAEAPAAAPQDEQQALGALAGLIK